MAELSDYVLPQPNPMAQFNQGIQSGMDWANKKASLDIQQQSVQDQVQRTKDMHDEFKFKVGNQMLDDYQKILPLKNGTYKNGLLDSFQDKYEQAGMPVHDSWISAAKDENYNKDLGDVLGNMKELSGSDPDSFKKIMQNTPEGFKQELLIDKLKNNMDMAKMQSMLKAKNDATNDRQQERLDYQAHQKVLQRLNQNPGLNQRLNQLQNLDNSLGLITDSDKLTPQQFQEFQQAVRSNLGIKGTSGVDERSGTYLNSLGLRAENWNQFLTADPQDIGKDNKLVKHVMQLAQIERRNAQSQYDKKLKAVTAGNEDMYDRRPELKQGLDSAISAFKGQLESPNQGNSTQNSQSQSSSQNNDAKNLQQAARFKQKYDSIPDPQTKKMALEKAKQLYGADALSKVGIQ